MAAFASLFGLFIRRRDGLIKSNQRRHDTEESRQKICDCGSAFFVLWNEKNKTKGCLDIVIKPGLFTSGVPCMEFLLHKTPPYSVYKKVKTSEALSTNAAILSLSWSRNHFVWTEQQQPRALKCSRAIVFCRNCIFHIYIITNSRGRKFLPYASNTKLL